MLRTISLSLLTLLFLPLLCRPIAADEPASQAPASQAPAADAAPTSCLLRYRLSEGELIRYEVEHLAKTKTRIRGTEDISNVQTVSTKVWRVIDISPDGEFTFEHFIESVSMSQQHGDAEPLQWDSTSGEAPPSIFQPIADQLGQTIAEVRINARGQEKSRKDDVGTKTDLGMGGLTIPLPEKKVEIGDSWSVPRQIRARTPAGEVKVIKVRELYTLAKISAGVATIRVQSQPLTPIPSPKIKSQVVQQLSDGTVKFDLDAGRVLSKQLDWDETVVGFEGANSMMEYRARLTEEWIETTEIARQPAASDAR